MIAPMTACHRPNSPATLRSTALLLAVTLASNLALAAEPAPFDAPFEAPDDGNTAVFDPEFDASLPDIAQPAAPSEMPSPDRPDYPPPRVDGYLDVAFTNNDFSNLGFSETPGGYRLVAGFRLEELSSEHWLIAPEFGYLRIGKAETSSSVFDTNITRPGYNTTRTDISTLDATSLDLGVRVDRLLTPRFAAFLRGGIGFYHLSRNEDVNRSYVANNPGTEGGPFDGVTESLLSASASTSGFGPYAGLGLSVQLGQVPALYLEYSIRDLDGERLGSTALGVTLNF